MRKRLCLLFVCGWLLHSVYCDTLYELSYILQEDNWVRDLEFSPDGVHMVSGNDNGLVRVWKTSEFAGGNYSHSYYPPDSYLIYGISFSGDGRYFVAGGRGLQNYVIALWDMNDLSKIAKQLSLPCKTPGFCTVYDIEFNPVKDVFAICTSHDGGMYYDIELNLVGRFNESCTDLEFTRDGDVLATSNGSQSGINLWDGTDLNPAGPLSSLNSGWGVSSTSFSSSKAYLAAGGKGTDLHRTDFVRVYDVHDPPNANPRWIYQGGYHSYFVYTLTYSPDDSLLVTAGGDGQIHFLDANDKYKLLDRLYDDPEVSIYTIDISGPFLASGRSDKTIRVYTKKT